MPDPGTLFFLVLLAALFGYWIGRRRPERAALSAAASETDPQGPESAPPDMSEIRQIATELLPIHNAAASPTELLDEPSFRRGVALLCDPSHTAEMLLDYYTGDSAILAFLGVEALACREGDPDVRPQILDGINDYIPWTRFFALRALEAQTPKNEPIVGRLLTRIDDSWQFPPNLKLLREFLERQARQDTKLAFGPEIERLDDEASENLIALFDRMSPAVVGGLREELTQWRSRRVDHQLLDSVGQVWDASQTISPRILSHPALETNADEVEAMLTGRPRRSVLLVGDHGVGKTAIAYSVARRLARKDWVIWEASHNELIAGAVYIGELEARLRELLEKLSRRRVLWIVKEFHTLALAGRHKFGPLSALDFLIPHIESGAIVMLGETRPQAFERLVKTKPRVLTTMETRRIEALPEDATASLVDRWAETYRTQAGEPSISPETRREVWLLADQYLADRAAPGNVLSLLDLTRQRCGTGVPGGTAGFGVDDAITTLSQLTGLPTTVLDERQGLDLEKLRRHFESRVMGQSEAIDCLVERVAMIRAGVTDPTRPFGVFLFAGPTGTGKTEIAKTLANFLFGSSDRMNRLDMSEFKDAESVQRLIGGAGQDEADSESLVDTIRKQPFSVVLLDEFEKAHSNIWDLFLQVFDDGRLTDRSGNTADFRNAIIIMTSNLGSKIPAGAGLGFDDQSGRFNEGAVHREIKKSFRPEFLNRIDRTVVFRPLERDTMREILRKDLAEAFKRRGLRNRAWAVEWDESGLEFLLEQGFTADLGARPLKRAIERHLLVPLAKTIVDHKYPEGDQFLFVRAESDHLVVEFVDPDAPDPHDDEVQSRPGPAVAPDPDAGVSLGRIALDPKGRPEEMATLRAIHQHLRETVDDESWQRAKRIGLEQIGKPEFWNSDARFEVLGRTEYLDRIEAGVKSAGSLLERLSGYGEPSRPRYPRDLLGRLASQLYLLDAACRGVQDRSPREAFLLVEAWSDGGAPSRAAGAFARRIGAMYRAWAERRRMQCTVLNESGTDGTYRLLLAVSGFAAYSILATESGLHLLETPADEGKKAHKLAARVRIAAQPEQPPARGKDLTEQARAALASQQIDGVTIVRRYRERPSPLVRDQVKGWRTGKLDRVLLGDFDLLGDERSDARPPSN